MSVGHGDVDVVGGLLVITSILAKIDVRSMFTYISCTFCMIYRIVLAIALSLIGVIVIIPLSLGNNPNNRSPRRLLVALLFALAYTL
jgi:hypothetical protein